VASPRRPDGLNAVDLADLLLARFVRTGAVQLSLEPHEGGYSLTCTAEVQAGFELDLPAALGQAVAVRLALLADLDPWTGENHVGRLHLGLGDGRSECVVAMRDGEAGLSLELRRLAALLGERTATVQAGRVETGQVGPYRILDELGRGAMGIVYRAQRIDDGRPVAVKILHSDRAREPAAAAQFVREGRAASLVNDDGVVGVSDFGTLPDGCAYLVMELIEGRTLAAILRERTALPHQEAVRIARRIAAALAAAHVRGVVHCDLKPSNVFVLPDGRVKIVDFGAARLAARAAEAGESLTEVIIGTPAYMAPEQALGRGADERADVYALGCILFQMLSGRAPYGGAGMETLLQHVTAPLPALTSPFGALPAALVECVMRAMSKRPEERQAGAASLSAGLEQSLADADRRSRA
jgi:serine/threonine-protein kinase